MIVGLVSLDGAPVDGELLSRMVVARQPPSSEVRRWDLGRFAVAHAGLPVGDERRAQAQVHRDEGARTLVVLEGRVDAKADLRAALGKEGGSLAPAGDAELILRAYRKWGDNCARNILGEFVFAIWDGPAERAIFSRDPSGLHPFFYSDSSGRLLRFATGANQLLQDPGVPRDVDVTAVLDFIISRNALYPDRTPWSAIKRLPAGSTLITDRGGIRIRRHWSVGDDPELGLGSSEERAEALAAAIQDAIRDRVADSASAGLLLSGGWDSGSLFCLWQALRERDDSVPPPSAYTFYMDFPESDEREDVRALLERWPAEWLAVHVSTGEDVLDGLMDHSGRLGLPEPAQGWRSIDWIARHVWDRGHRVLASGIAGEMVARSSLLRSAELMSKGRLRRGWAELRLSAAELGTSPRSILRSEVLRPLLPIMWPTSWDLGRRIRAKISMKGSSSLPFLRADLQRALPDITAPLVDSYRRAKRSETLTRWSLKESTEGFASELFAVPPGYHLQGVGHTLPYVDRRVIRAGHEAIAAEDRPGARQVLQDAVRLGSGYRLRGRYAHIGGWGRETLGRYVMREPRAFQPSVLAELRIVDPARFRSYLDDFATDRAASIMTLWRVVAAEFWARRWIATEGDRGRR